MALIVNLLRDPKKSQPVKAEDFNPYRVRSRDNVIPNVPLSVLKDIFVKK